MSVTATPRRRDERLRILRCFDWLSSPRLTFASDLSRCPVNHCRGRRMDSGVRELGANEGLPPPRAAAAAGEGGHRGPRQSPPRSVEVSFRRFCALAFAALILQGVVLDAHTHTSLQDPPCLRSAYLTMSDSPQYGRESPASVTTKLVMLGLPPDRPEPPDAAAVSAASVAQGQGRGDTGSAYMARARRCVVVCLRCRQPMCRSCLAVGRVLCRERVQWRHISQF
jgi:hypothetical protein